MTVREILLWPDPRLSQPCDPVTEIGAATAALVEDLFETMYAAQGRGLAAPQIGVMQQVFVTDTGWKEGAPRPRAMVNPQILDRSAAQTDMEENCLSIPDFPLQIRRPSAVTVQWHDAGGAEHSAAFEGAEARVIQHEYAHLRGTVIFHAFPPDTARALEAQFAQARP